MKIEKLSAANLKKEMDKLSDERSAICDKLIEAGRGYELQSETMQKNDSLSLEFRAVATKQINLGLEKRRRLDYSGSLKPIPE